ncbi:MAG: 5'-deoxynucleotidase [Clostridia bacterium]
MSNFYALINRMKYIKRWSLMRNNLDENLLEHSAQVAIVAHALALIGNEKFNRNTNADLIATIALFHDASEVITGDMPTPIKYNNPKINGAYKEMEALADAKLLSMLPDYLEKSYKKLFEVDNTSYEYKIVKSADKLSAYIKCLEELSSGNNEFSIAKVTIEKSLLENPLPEVKYFLENFLDGFNKPLDVL